MHLARLGSAHPHRLSFMRILLRRLKSDNWYFTNPVFDITPLGVGRAVYTAHGPMRSYSLVAFAHDLPDEKRSDRVIADAWDATFTLFDGVPSTEDITRLARNVPLQEAGRVTEKELTLARANRSVRLFDHVLACLASGRQPEFNRLNEVGYLMRTTAVYGSGKFGAADREIWAERPEFTAPFQPEMLTVFLIRAFVADLIEHLARGRAPKTAVAMDPALRRGLGIGNSTGLGMAPFLIKHPVLFHHWIMAREKALAWVRSQEQVPPAIACNFRQWVYRAAGNAELWQTEHPLQVEKIAALKTDLQQLIAYVETNDLETRTPWDRLYRWATTHLSLEGQEQLVSLLLEPNGELIDGLADSMSLHEEKPFRIDSTMTVRTLCQMIENHYAWALSIDWNQSDNQARIWYLSAEKLEPRLGERFASTPLGVYEQPIAPGRDVATLYQALGHMDPKRRLAAVLVTHPELRHSIRRVQITSRFPYAEIRDNTIGHTFLPIDMLRCKLAFFGANHFDPRSDRWVRINMFRHAPYPHELATSEADDWLYPRINQ